MESGEPRLGDLLAGRFRLAERLGRGETGVVFRADDTLLGETVALKLLPTVPGAASTAELFSEVALARRITHPNVCRVFDVGQWGAHHFFITMEFVEGENLATLLQRRSLDLHQATRLAVQLCAALEAAHRAGVLHRDLKPENVLVDRTGRICITDFGLARTIDDPRSEEPTVGTPAYMAPEQILGRTSRQSDLFALGLLLFQLYAGHSPIRAGSLDELVEELAAWSPPSRTDLPADLPPEVAAVVLSCMAREPGERPLSAKIVLQALTEFGTHRPAKKPLRQRIAPAFGLALLGLLGLGPRDEAPAPGASRGSDEIVLRIQSVGSDRLRDSCPPRIENESSSLLRS